MRIVYLWILETKKLPSLYVKSVIANLRRDYILSVPLTFTLEFQKVLRQNFNLFLIFFFFFFNFFWIEYIANEISTRTLFLHYISFYFFKKFYELLNFKHSHMQFALFSSLLTQYFVIQQLSFSLSSSIFADLFFLVCFRLNFTWCVFALTLFSPFHWCYRDK